MEGEYIERNDAINRIRRVASMIGFENPAIAIDCCVSILERVPAVNANKPKEGESTGYQPRLIDANALWSDIQMLPHNGDIISSEDVEQEIIDAPTIDAKVVKHGYWIHTIVQDEDWGHTFHKWSCSICNYSTGSNPTDANYCSCCGAQMDLEAKDK